MEDENMRYLDGRVGEGMEGESNERHILINGPIMGLGRNLIPGSLGNPQGRLQLIFLALVERVSELVFSYNQVGDNHNCQHRIFIQ